MFGNDLTNGKKGMNKIMQYMMMSKMMGESGLNGSTGAGGMNQMLPFMMMGGMGNGFSNMFGNLFDDEYIERQQTKCATKQNDLPIEKRIINEYFSEAVVEKEYAKILSENPEIEKGVLIPRLLNICFYTLLTEESWNFVKQFKNPTVDFKKLRNEVVNKIKKVKPDLFTKN